MEQKEQVSKYTLEKKNFLFLSFFGYIYTTIVMNHLFKPLTSYHG